MRPAHPLILFALAGLAIVSGAGAQPAPPTAALSLDFRLSRADLKCLVDTSGSLLEHSEPISFSPDLCVNQAALDALLSGSQRTSLPNWKTTLPDHHPGGGAAGTPATPRFIFSRKTLKCLVAQSRHGDLTSGDPVHIDLRNCP